MMIPIAVVLVVLFVAVVLTVVAMEGRTNALLIQQRKEMETNRANGLYEDGFVPWDPTTPWIVEFKGTRYHGAEVWELKYKGLAFHFDEGMDDIKKHQKFLKDVAAANEYKERCKVHQAMRDATVAAEKPNDPKA
jgi:hypothetical protein